MFITAFSKPKQDKAKVELPNKDAQEKLIDHLQLSCHICASPYDAFEKIPIIICQEQHTYCLLCVNQLFSHRPNAQRCPSCRVFVTKNATYTNKTLLRLCDLVPGLAAQFTNLAKQNLKLQEEKRAIQKEVAKLKNPQYQEGDCLESKIIHNSKIKMEDLQNHFPRIIDANGLKKYSKIDIKGFLARKRLSSNKQNKRHQKKEYNQRQKIRSLKP